MKLILKHEGEERAIELPVEVLTALWTNATSLVLACVGWSPRSGVLTEATAPDKVTRSEDGTGVAGMLNVTLTEEVRASEKTLNESFLDYGTRLRSRWAVR